MDLKRWFASRIFGADLSVAEVEDGDKERYAIATYQVNSPEGGIPDGSDIAQGSIEDDPWSGSGDGTVISILKGLFNKPASGYTATVTGTFTCDTSAYAPNDVVTDTVILTNLAPEIDAEVTIKEITIHDLDDTSAYDMEAVFLKANVSLGTKNAAPNMSDGDAANVQNKAEIAATDMIDLTNSKKYFWKGRPFDVKPIAGTRNVAMTMKVGPFGTPTHSASGLTYEVKVAK